MNIEELDFTAIVSPLLSWYESKARILPWRMNTDPYRVWVSEIMLQQTRVEAVIPYYLRFMENFPDVQALATAPEEQVLKLWEGLGYYSRAKNLKKAAESICHKFNGDFPENYQDILALPGIGKYTAGAVSSIAFNKPYAAVDGNVMRVIARISQIEGDIRDDKLKKQVGEKLEAVYPENYCSQFTQSLMELGAVVCIPNGVPKCDKCPIQKDCLAYQTGTQAEYPVKIKKAERKRIEKTVFVLFCEGKVAVRKRENKGLLAGLWEFPNIDKKMDRMEAERWLTEHHFYPSKFQDHKRVKHIFTHLEWNMNSYLFECSKENNNYVWVSINEMDESVTLPTAFRKCLFM